MLVFMRHLNGTVVTQFIYLSGVLVFRGGDVIITLPFFELLRRFLWENFFGSSIENSASAATAACSPAAGLGSRPLQWKWPLSGSGIMPESKGHFPFDRVTVAPIPTARGLARRRRCLPGPEAV